jgi:hypothetical protein
MAADMFSMHVSSRFFWVAMAAVSCSGSLSAYKEPKTGPGDLDPVDPTTTGYPTTEPTDVPLTDPTDPGPNCDSRADCDDPRCDTVCDFDGDGEITEALGGRDCDDRDDRIHPGAIDDCDGDDNDCDGVVDGDGDNDGFDVCDDCDDDDRSVNPDHADPCDGSDSDCDLEDCSPYEEDFEQLGLGAVWIQSGDANWGPRADWAYRGTQSMQSGVIGASESTVVSITFDLSSDGSVSFFTKGDTEASYDEYRFKIDGVLTDVRSGEWAWTQVQYPLTAGQHELRWSYTKDSTRNVGADRAAVDNLVVENGRPL